MTDATTHEGSIPQAPEAQRVALQVPWWHLCCTLLAFLVTACIGIWGILVSHKSLEENAKLRNMALREELYSNERWWYDRMNEHAFAYSLLTEFSGSEDAEAYIQTCVELASPGKGKPLPAPTQVEDLLRLLWSPENFAGEHEANDSDSRKANLRRTFDVAEVMFYHLERIHTYCDEGIMDKEETNTWVGLLHQVGPHPLLLAVAEDARRHGYVSADFAQWFADSLSEHPRWSSVAAFYPRLVCTPEQWVADFRKAEVELRFLYPKGRPEHRADSPPFTPDSGQGLRAAGEAPAGG